MTRTVASGKAVVTVWVGVLFGITAIGILPLFVYRLDLSTLTFSTPVPVVAGIGIELTAYAPTLAALLVAGLMPGAGGIRRLLRPVLRWRLGPQWYLLALVGPTVLFLVGDLVRLLLNAPLPAQWLALPGPATIAFLVGALIAGSFGEEVGWRGLGQARLQVPYGALTAAVVVGALWSLWHLWPVVAPGGLGDTTLCDVVLTFVRLIATAILYAWLYNSTRGSLLIVMLAHAGHNLAANFVPLAGVGNHADPITAALYVAAAIVVLALAGPRWLSRIHEYPELVPARPLG
ncbi:MAG: CPBP family intramembrane metalloprotease [Chloroflexota bacterium]|nr:CPBP family intramembrane metalloprotease [Chloroflexota bacterium]